MKSKTKQRWIPIEQRGDRENFPLMPAILTLYRSATSKTQLKKVGVKCPGFLMVFSLKDAKNFVQENEWQKFCSQCYQKVKKNLDIQKKLVKEFKKRVPRFLRFCKKVHKELKNG